MNVGHNLHMNLGKLYNMQPLLFFQKILRVVAAWFGLKRGKVAMSIEKDEIDDEEVRLKAYRWCRDSLHSSWASIDEDDIIVKRLSGGLTNYLYLCYLPSDVEIKPVEPRCVLLRVYGHVAKTSKEFVVHNSVVFAILSEKGLGPKLYGIYHDGRIEEYIPTKSLRRMDLQSPKVSQLIAQKLAQFHGLDMPLCKEPRWLYHIINGWVHEIQNNFAENLQKCPEVMKLMSMNLEEELDCMMKILSQIESPVVFCHNDLQEGNILYIEENPDKTKQMTVIDWEYCSYNYRGFDFGNHFLEWCYDYADNPDPPYYSFHPEDYPSRKRQYEFFREYLAVMGQTAITDEDLHNMYVEANTFALASHFLWGVWSLVQSQTCAIKFGFMEYAVCRFEGYFKMKEQLLYLGSQDEISSDYSVELS
ncbi:choline/ethanolamine kinase-like [Gigantopelta aegis]|uniref:choline/ethanolamine kinase-like n=1 Tax=Gigantopelta aegis TaxID=1735272 RepID=UPI001B88AC6E|nr:choline/ethanolamine kinase-like [Gigantopelta aegis]